MTTLQNMSSKAVSAPLYSLVLHLVQVAPVCTALHMILRQIASVKTSAPARERSTSRHLPSFTFFVALLHIASVDG